MPLRILLIEDDPMSQDVIRALCESRGHAVHVAADGFDGLRMLRSCRYDVALVDYHLPAMDGYALARLMRDICNEELRLIGITADQLGLASRRGADALFDAMLSKPLTPAALFKVVETSRTLPAIGHGFAAAVLGETAFERARAAAAAFWRRRGGAGLPRAFPVTAPSDDEAGALRQCFDLVEAPAQADLLLLLDPAGRRELARLRMTDDAFLLPSVDLSECCSEADVAFRVDDLTSWTAVVGVAASFRRRREQLRETAAGPTRAAERVLAYWYVADRDGTGRAGCGGFAAVVWDAAVVELAGRGHVRPCPGGGHEMTAAGIAAVTGKTMMNAGAALDHLVAIAPGLRSPTDDAIVAQSRTLSRLLLENLMVLLRDSEGGTSGEDVRRAALRQAIAAEFDEAAAGPDAARAA